MGIEVRAATRADRDDILRIAVTSGLFAEDQVGGFAAVADAELGVDGSPSIWLVATDGGGRPVGALYAGPEPFGDRVWNLFFLAVDAAAHARGAGSALVAALVERLVALGADHARILIVDTSSGPSQERARAFYLARGFHEEARVREYYGPTEDKVTFWRRLP